MDPIRLAGRSRRLLALAIAAALQAAPAAATPPEAPDRPIRIHLRHDAFDPLERPPAIPARLANAAVGSTIHVVQFRGPIGRAEHAALERAGLTAVGYVPDFALLVRGSAEQVRALSADPAMRWAGPWLPAFRLDPQLLPRAERPDPAHRQEVRVLLFPGHTAAALGAGLPRGAVVRRGPGAAGHGSHVLRLEVADTALAALAERAEVAWIEPVFPVRRANATARAITGKDHVESVMGLFGAGQVVGVGDDGLSTGDMDTIHPDFEGRVAGTASTDGGAWGFGSASAHGTHVAGTVLGSGLLDGSDPGQQHYTGFHAGVAPEARLFAWALCPCDDSLTLPDDLADDYLLPQYQSDPQLRISNNSWGTEINVYTILDRSFDQFVRGHPDMLVVVAAGNSGPAFNTVGSPGIAKNALTVGAIVNSSQDHPAYSVSSISSRGPAADGRIKPEVVAPGFVVTSTVTSTAAGVEHTYADMGGTSMASPVVSGAAAIVRQFYQEIEGLPQPGAALVKATLINGAQNVSGSQVRVPDRDQGWGRIDLRESLVHTEGRRLWYYQHPGLSTDESFSATLAVSDSTVPLRATLVWSDTEALTSVGPNLVNDLDLMLAAPPDADPDLYTGNDRIGDLVLDLDVDRLHNVEGIDVPEPPVGEWTLTVTGYNTPFGPQPFALVLSGPFAPWSALQLELTPDAATVCAGQQAVDVFELAVRRFRSDLTEPVQLSVDGLPGTVTPQFSVDDVPADFHSSLSFQLGAATPGGDHALLIEALAGAESASAGATLTVLPLPSAPEPTSPVEGATSVPPSLVLHWNEAAGADDGYQVVVARDAGFTDVVHEATTNDTSLPLPVRLDLLATYYWRVTALNGCGSTAGPVHSFTVAGTSIFEDGFEPD